MRQLRSVRWFFLSALLATGLRAGTIVGHVRAQGADIPAQSGGDGAYASRRYKFVEKVNYDELDDFVVYIDGPVASPAPANATKPAIVQRDANFEPHVLPVAVGTVVRWPNEDDIFHNVFSMSDAKEFDLKLYKKEKVPEITFDRTGRVDVFCAIHSNMHCIVLVLPNAYFAKADHRGRYAIAGVPAGTYRVRAWQERVPSQAREVVVPADGEVRADFVLGLANLPKY